MRSIFTAASLLAIVAGTTFAQITQTTTTTTTTTTQPVVITDSHAVITPQSRRPVWHHAAAPVKIDRVDVSLTLNEQVATTLIELTVMNPGSTPQQAELLIPVPDGASVRSLQYDGTGPEPTAKVLPRDEARRIYDSIVGSMRDPALLEFARYGVLRTSAFPIPANSSQKIRITLEQVIAADGGRLDWMLPRTEMLAGTGTPWSFKATIKSSDAIASVYSASHDLKVQRTGPGEFTVTGDTNALRAAGSLRLSAMKASKNPGEPVFSTAAYPDASLPGGGRGYFNLMVALPSPAAGDRSPVKREVTVVLDRSGSMRGEKFKQAVEAAKNVLSGLNDGEMFNIIDYCDAISAFGAAPVVKDGESLKRGLAYLDALQVSGGTNIRDALVEAVHNSPKEGMLPLVVFLTDGLPTVGERNEAAIRASVKAANTANRRLFTFGVGFDVNSPLLSALASSTRASATYVTPDENIEVKVGQLFRRLNGPIFASPKVTIIDSATEKPTTTAVRDMQPTAAEMPDVFDGEQLMICGQYSAGQKFKVRIDGEYLGKAHTFEYEIDPAHASAQNAYIPRMWASKRIAMLIEAVRTDYAQKQIDPRNDPRAKELIDEIVSLSTRFGILTEYTAFLATEPTVTLHDDAELRARVGHDLDGNNALRGGVDAVKQEGKLADMKSGGGQGNLNGAPAAASPGALGGNQVQYRYAVGDDRRSLKKEELINVNQVQDRTFFRRNDRWVEGANITKETEAPERTVTVGTDDYSKLADELLAANLGGLLALEGDVYFMWKSQRVLLKNSAAATPVPAPQP
jgi:Ca-activated chloride channel family protein